MIYALLFMLKGSSKHNLFPKRVYQVSYSSVMDKVVVDNHPTRLFFADCLRFSAARA